MVEGSRRDIPTDEIGKSLVIITVENPEPVIRCERMDGRTERMEQRAKMERVIPPTDESMNNASFQFEKVAFTSSSSFITLMFFGSVSPAARRGA